MQVQLVDEPAVERRELRIAGELDDAVVECEVRVVVGVDVAAPRPSPCARRDRATARPAGRALCAARRPANSSSTARSFEDVVGFLDAIWRTNDAAVLLEPHEPDSSRARNASRTGPRDTPSIAATSVSRSLRARREIAGEDHPLDLALHEARQRVGLERGSDGRRDGTRRRRRLARCGGRTRAQPAGAPGGAGRARTADFSTLRLDVAGVDCQQSAMRAERGMRAAATAAASRRARVATRVGARSMRRDPAARGRPVKTIGFPPTRARVMHGHDAGRWLGIVAALAFALCAARARAEDRALVYTALETDQIKAYEEAFNKAIRTSTSSGCATRPA
jgi:hypothetical protein